MKTSLGHLIVLFFRSHLAARRNCSPNTIASYSECVRLLLQYACAQLRVHVDQLGLEDITDQIILDFLDHLEQDRRNSPASRNQRLGAIKSFYRFLAQQEPLLLPVCERVGAIRAKKTAHKLIAGLDPEQVQAILQAPGPDTANGCRDRALLLMFDNTGARVQELCDLDVGDLRLEHPAQVLLTGKGRKQRLVPLWPETVHALEQYLQTRLHEKLRNQPLFLNSHGKRLSRFGVGYLVRRYATLASRICPSLRLRRVTPHTFRHTTALQLIQSHADIVTVRDWLGHVDIRTTSQYVQIDLEMKRQALDRCPAPSLVPGNRKPEWTSPQILSFLTQLSKRSALCEENSARATPVHP
jgi:site-specific recombinase XerD